MGDKERNFSGELDWQEEERILEEVNRDPNVANKTAPKGMREEVFREIRAYETAKVMVEKEMFTEENRELIRLGKLYRKKKKRRKYYVLATVLVLAMVIGTTSMGEAEKVFRIFSTHLFKRNQTQVDSEENVVQNDDLKEEQIIEEIEEKFGFYPVKLNYLPEGTGFWEGELEEDIQRIYMFYGNKERIKLSYFIRPNFRESSWGNDTEDKLDEKYEVELENAVVQIRKYIIEDNTIRWIVSFEYKNVNYCIHILDEERTEVEKIVKNLYFI